MDGWVDGWEVDKHGPPGLPTLSLEDLALELEERRHEVRRLVPLGVVLLHDQHRVRANILGLSKLACTLVIGEGGNERKAERKYTSFIGSITGCVGVGGHRALPR